MVCQSLTRVAVAPSFAIQFSIQQLRELMNHKCARRS